MVDESLEREASPQKRYFVSPGYQGNILRTVCIFWEVDLYAVLPMNDGVHGNVLLSSSFKALIGHNFS